MGRLATGYALTRADPSEVLALIDINVASDTLFAETGLIRAEDLGDHIPAAFIEAGIREREVFVVREEAAEPVGFTLTSLRGGALYLDQISVHPGHGQKGLGRALMERVFEDARQRRFKYIILSTFRDVAWNGPFYRSLGFHELKRGELSDWMLDLEAAQAESLDTTKRCFMRKRLRWF